MTHGVGAPRKMAVWPDWGWWCAHPGSVEPGPRALNCGNSIGAGEGNRTLMTSLEGWGSAIELRPRRGSAARCSVPGSRWSRRGCRIHHLVGTWVLSAACRRVPGCARSSPNRRSARRDGQTGGRAGHAGCRSRPSTGGSAWYRTKKGDDQSAGMISVWLNPGTETGWSGLTIHS
jgi:hypothetical protein